MLPEAQIKRIIASQIKRETRLAAADDVIDNSGDLAALHQQVRALHEKYLALAKA
jgi:dephospho-CoA kinase